MAKAWLSYLMIVAGVATSCFALQPFNMVHPNRTLIVLSAPSVWDDNYKEDFFDIISFQIDFARTIHVFCLLLEIDRLLTIPLERSEGAYSNEFSLITSGVINFNQEHENVVVLADKHTMPYLDGRSSRIQKRLPHDALIETNIYDINLNDFAPMGYKQLTKFIYRSPFLVDLASTQIDESMNKFLTDNHIRLDKREQDMILSGEDIVHNGVNKALISDSVIIKNAGRVPDWAMMIKLLNAFKKVAIIGNPLNGTRLRLDDIMGFIDEEMLAISPLDHEIREELETAIKKKFRNDLSIIDLPLGGAANDDGNCGIYTAVMSTNKYVYVPVFGNDPNNWKFGYSTMTDRMVLHLLEANSRRKIIPVNIPRALCRRGLSLRSLSWTIRGYAADSIINLARKPLTK